ncbi:MAG: ParA family protein [Actinomycetales bacterium]
MKPVILIANLSGGVGKTTLTQAIATASAEYGKKTLAIDADPNATLTFLAGIENPRFTLREVIEKSVTIQDSATRTVDRYSLIPSASRLLFADGKVPDFTTEEFDVVLVDSASGPSSLLPLLIESATYILVPVDGSMLSIRGALNLNNFIGKSMSQAPVKVVINNGRNFAQFPELLGQLKEDFQFLESNIPFESTVNQAQESLQSPLSFATNSDFSAGIRELTYEILEELKLI